MLSLDQPAVLDSDVNATIVGPNQSCSKMGLFKNHLYLGVGVTNTEIKH